MRFVICSIYDSAAEAFMVPFFVQSEGQAARAFEDLAKDPQQPIGQHPADYTLMSVGGFNDQNGEVEGHTPKRITSGLEAIQRARVRAEAQRDFVNQETERLEKAVS